MNRGLNIFPHIYQLNDLKEMPNSIYHNINFEKAFQLLEKNSGIFLIIGLPCHITSINLLLEKRKYASLKSKVFAKISLICGYSFDRINSIAFQYFSDFQANSISYRENGRFRKTRLFNNIKNIVFEKENPRNIIEHINHSMFFDAGLAQQSCLYCIDHIGYCADLVVGDAWQPRYKNDRKGSNIVIVRTKIGDNLLHQIPDFHLEKGTLSEIVESQSEKYVFSTLGQYLREQLGDEYIKQGKGEHSVSCHDIKKLKNRVKIKKLLTERKFNEARKLYIFNEKISLLKKMFSIFLRKGKLK